jgi:hypothetical protein
MEIAFKRGCVSSPKLYEGKPPKTSLGALVESALLSDIETKVVHLVNCRGANASSSDSSE